MELATRQNDISTSVIILPTTATTPTPTPVIPKIKARNLYSRYGTVRYAVLV